MANEKNTVVNIAYCTDANYLEYVATSIISVILNNKDARLAFYVFVYDVTADNIEKLKATSPLIQLIEIEKKDIEKYQGEFAIKHLNRATYMRLSVPRLLQDKIERFIYLDADTLCFADISTINHVNITDVICAVSHDALDSHDNKHARRLGLTSPHYFNAGFLYINISNWIKYDIENKANTILLENKKSLPYLDQDALNIAMDGHVLFIDNSWNFIYNWFTEEQKENYFYDSNNLPKIIHFTGGRKPWFREHESLSQHLFLFYQHLTPWKNSALRHYAPKMRPTDYRVYSRQFLKKGKYIEALKWFAKYLAAKSKK